MYVMEGEAYVFNERTEKKRKENNRKRRVLRCVVARTLGGWLRLVRMAAK
jgi:hypothetical protein